jgi:hypothetical protein
VFLTVQVSSLVYSRCQAAVREWLADMVESWDFKQVVPSHFDAPVPCNGRELIAAFQRSTDVYNAAHGEGRRGTNTTEDGQQQKFEGLGFLQQLLELRKAGSRPGENVLDPADLKALENVNGFLEGIRAVARRSGTLTK